MSKVPSSNEQNRLTVFVLRRPSKKDRGRDAGNPKSLGAQHDRLKTILFAQVPHHEKEPNLLELFDILVDQDVRQNITMGLRPPLMCVLIS